MDFWYVLIGVVALVVIFPYARCLVKRLSCMFKIKGVCRRKRYKLHKTHFLWFLGSKRAKRCDCYIETPNEVLAIKLFGTLKRSTVLIFKENGEYFIRGFISSMLHGSSFHFPTDGKPRPLPEYDFQYKYRNEWKLKTPRRIVWVNPVSMDFCYQPKQGSETVINAGDIVNGVEIESLPHLLSEIGNEA